MKYSKTSIHSLSCPGALFLKAPETLCASVKTFLVQRHLNTEKCIRLTLLVRRESESLFIEYEYVNKTPLKS